MRKIIAFSLCLLSTLSLMAQRPFEGHFYCKEVGVNLFLNLYEESLEAPGFSFLGKMHGYMRDGIYGTWMVTKCSIKKNTATIRFSNDIGSDSQDIVLKLLPDSTYSYHAVGDNAIRRAEGRKLVKVTGDMVFKRVD